MTLTGERLTTTTRRLRTPTASEWRDGRFVDSGLAMILSSNFAHLQRESVRHLATALGPGVITNASRGYSYSGTTLKDRPDPGAYTGLSAIAWDVATATRLGPFTLIADREIAAEDPTWRQIRVNVDADSVNLALYAALTAGDPPAPDHLGFATVNATAGRAINALTLTPSRGIRADRMPARRPDGATDESTLTATVFLWVGWYAASGTNAVVSITANEIR